MLTMILASPLALGWYVAFPVFALLVPVFVYRLIHEERTLRSALTGYANIANGFRTASSHMDGKGARQMRSVKGMNS